MGTAWAQTAAEGGGAPLGLQLVPLGVLIVIFYFLLLRPEQRKRREHEQMIGALKRSDHVVTASGIHGRVTGTGEKVVTVEIAPRVAVTMDRTAIQRIERAGGEPRAKEKEKERSRS